MRLCDAHCHLQDDRLAGSLDAVLARARAAGVRRVVCCGASESDWDGVAALARRLPDLVPAFGLHPWYVAGRTAAWLERLGRLLDAFPAAGVGEIGLDQALPERDDTDQAVVFEVQLELAAARRRPASIHCRRAWGALLGILARCPPPAGFVVHSYSGAPELIDPLVRLGGYVSFSGSITRSHNRRAHRALRAAPLDRLLFETDAPDIPPVIDGRAAAGPNEPANLAAVLRAASDLRGEPVATLAGAAWGNASRLFGTAAPDVEAP